MANTIFFYMNARISYKNLTVQKTDVSEGIDTNKTSAPKEFDQLKNIGQKFYCSDVSINKYVVKCGTSLRFWENVVLMKKVVLMK